MKMFNLTCIVLFITLGFQINCPNFDCDIGYFRNFQTPCDAPSRMEVLYYIGYSTVVRDFDFTF